MESHVLHTVWCNIAGEAEGEIWNWSFLGVKGLNLDFANNIKKQKPFPGLQLSSSIVTKLNPLKRNPTTKIYLTLIFKLSTSLYSRQSTLAGKNIWSDLNNLKISFVQKSTQIISSQKNSYNC